MMSKTLRALSFLSVHRFVDFLQASFGHDDAGPSESGVCLWCSVLATLFIDKVGVPFAPSQCHLSSSLVRYILICPSSRCSI